MKKYFALLIGSAALLMTSCKEDTVPQPDTLAPTALNESMNVTDIKRASAHISGRVTPAPGQSFDEFGLIVSRNPNLDYTHYDYIFRNVTEQSVAGLPSGTNFYFAPYAKNAMTVVLGDVMSFTTATTSAPNFSLPEVSEQSTTGGLVKSTLLDVGSPTTGILIGGYVYKAVGVGEQIPNEALQLNTPGVQTVRVDNGNEPAENETMQLRITGLNQNTRYAVRAFGVADGVGYSDINYIQTGVIEKPTIGSPSVNDLGNATATIVDSRGMQVIEAGFCYSTSDNNTNPTLDNSEHVVGTIDGNTVSASIIMAQNINYYISSYMKVRNSDGVEDKAYGDAVTKRTELDLSGYVTYDSLKALGYMTTGEVQALIAEALKEYAGTNDIIYSLESRIEELRAQLESGYISQEIYNAEYKTLQEDIQSLKNSQDSILIALSDQATAIELMREAIMDSLRQETSRLNVLVATLNSNIDSLGGVISYQGEAIASLQSLIEELTGMIQTQESRIDEMSATIKVLQDALNELQVTVGSLQEAKPLMVLFSNMDCTANEAAGSFSATATIDFNEYRQRYESVYGKNSVFGDDYYVNLFPISLTGFIYSTVNEEPNTDNYAAMIVAKPDNNYTFTMDATGLAGGTYYVRAFAVNSWGVNYSDVKKVTIDGTEPSSFIPGADDNPYPGTVGTKQRR